MIVIATQAHRKMMLEQKADEDGEAALTQHDENGNEYDYTNLVPTSPGEIGVLPPGVTVWESSQSDVNGIISAVKSDISALAAVTNTLISYLLPGGENISGNASEQGNDAFFFKVKDRQKRFKQPLQEILRIIYEIEGEEAPEQISATFASPMRQSITQIGQAWSQMAGLPLASKLKYVMQLSPSEIEEVLQEASQEKLEEMMFNPVPVQEVPLSSSNNSTN